MILQKTKNNRTFHRLLDCLCFDCWKERNKITQKNGSIEATQSNEKVASNIKPCPKKADLPKLCAEKKKDYSCCNNQASEVKE